MFSLIDGISGLWESGKWVVFGASSKRGGSKGLPLPCLGGSEFRKNLSIYILVVIVVVVVVDSHVQRLVLATEETMVTQQVSQP